MLRQDYGEERTLYLCSTAVPYHISGCVLGLKLCIHDFK